ncbi:MAG: hypothetical protein M5U14_07755 [Acidimicrobiia bacterium]|nr:hypothetical protein [Acidimicrobiia bacterium]
MIDSRRNRTDKNSLRSSTPKAANAFVNSFTDNGGWYINVPNNRSTNPCASPYRRSNVAASSSENRAIDANVLSISACTVKAVPSSNTDAICTSGRTYSTP